MIAELNALTMILWIVGIAGILWLLGELIVWWFRRRP